MRDTIAQIDGFSETQTGVQVHVGNRSHTLVEKLKRQLYSSSNIFTRKLLVIPCDSVKKKLESLCCNDPNLGVFMGVRSLNLNLAMGELLSFFPRPHFFPTQSELAFFLHGEMNKWLTQYAPPFAKPFMEYMRNISCQKEGMATLSDKLAGLFLKYGLYFGQEYQQWKEKGGWQGYLYQKCCEHFSFPLEIFDQLALKSQTAPSAQLHIFGVAHIPAVYLNIIEQCAKHMPVHIYIPSYSPLYWGDLISSKQLYKMQKQETSLHQQLELEHYYDAQNPLFANLCRFGQPVFSELIDRNWEVSETYDEIEPKTLLSHLQSNLFMMEAPQSDKETIETIDDSLQFWRAPNKWAEIENIHSQLLSFIEAKMVSCDHMVVLAPNIDVYAPFIEAIFGAQSSPVGYCIEGTVARDDFYQLVDHLLNMIEGRWDKDSLLKLFDFKVIQDLLDIDERKWRLVCDWLNQSHFIWGYNLEHRKQFVKTSGGDLRGTLEFSFDQILNAFVLSQGSTLKSSIDFSLAPLIEKLIGFFRRLYIDTQKMKHGEYTLKEWYLLLCAFFTEFSCSHKSSDECDSFLIKLKNLFRIHTIVEGKTYPFCTIISNVKRLYIGKKGVLRTKGKAMIRFASIQQGEAYFGDVIALIGMDQSQFPRTDDPHSFDLLRTGQYSSDYIPQVSHGDRYFILEALSHAKKSLIFSSLTRDEEGSAEEFAAPVSEVLHHLDRTFVMANGDQLSKQCVHEVHPLNLDPVRLANSYNKEPMLWAKEYYEGKNAPTFSLHTGKNIESGHHILTIQSLIKLVRNPIQYVCNEVLNLYHNSGQRDELWLREFVLSHWERGGLRLETLNGPIEKIIAQIEHEYPLTSPLFTRLAQLHIQEDIESITESFNKYGIYQEDLFSISLSPFSEANSHQPLIVKPDAYTTVEIRGTLENVHQKGIVVARKSQYDEWLKVWPQLLILDQIEDERLREDRGVIFLRDGKSKGSILGNSQEALQHLVTYALQVQSHISLFLPSLAQSVLKHDEKRFQKEVELLFSDQQLGGLDPYVHWIFKSSNEFLASVEFDLFAKEITDQFQLFSDWASQKKGVEYGNV